MLLPFLHLLYVLGSTQATNIEKLVTYFLKSGVKPYQVCRAERNHAEQRGRVSHLDWRPRDAGGESKDKIMQHHANVNRPKERKEFLAGLPTHDGCMTGLVKTNSSLIICND